ncbi:MAG TPA: hypothetical protein PKE31_08540 [Pseudomonadota bacterium]|jgi:hypothetical protein|nr:hypothetical protein [Pseudomonadota bacterium]
MDHAAREALCRRCGVSCHFAIPVNGLAVVLPELRCRYLAKVQTPLPVATADERFHCTVYEDRFEKAPWCMTAERAAEGGFLAQDCPYTKGVAGYRGKVRLSASLRKQVEPAIVAEILRVGVPVGADPLAVLSLLNKNGDRFRPILSDDKTRTLFVKDLPCERDS